MRHRLIYIASAYQGLESRNSNMWLVFSDRIEQEGKVFVLALYIVTRRNFQQTISLSLKVG